MGATILLFLTSYLHKRYLFVLNVVGKIKLN